MNFNSNQNDQINQSQSILSSSSSNNCLSSYTNADFLYHLKQKQQNLTIVPIDKEAPSIDNWYHGRLDRNRADLLLKDFNKPGSFLVRESEKSNGSYVLSYYSYNSTIHHFKITAVFGDYYIGGRQFDKLETLISYYMHYSELVKGERLQEPLSPNRVCHLEKFYVSIKTYEQKRVDTNKIEFDLIQNLENNNTNEEDDVLNIGKIGELYRVFYEIVDGEWFWAQSCKNNEYGLLKADCVRYVDDDKLHELEPWYYSNITKEEAVIILSNAGNCSYLVRPSDQSPGDYTLFFIADNLVHRFRITGCVSRTTLNETEKYFHIGGRDYTSISSIIQRYMNEDITEGFRLTKIPHKRPDNFPQDLSAIKDTTNQQNYRMSLSRGNSFSSKTKYMIQRDKLNFNEIFDENSKQMVKNNENYANGLSMSLNESSLKSITNSSNTNKFFNFRFNKPKLNDKNQIKSQASINEPNLEINHSIMSKSLSSPLTFNNVNPKNGFYDSNSGQQDSFLKTFSSSSSSSNKSNEPSQSNSSTSSSNNQSHIEPDILINNNRKSNKNIILKGYLNKYNEKSKKWKPYWFLLNQTDQQLFYFSDEKKIKEKGLIDLSYGFYYPIDHSFFNRPHCFQVIIHSLGSTLNTNGSTTNGSIVYYLCAENLKSFKEWTENIRPLCNPIQYNPFVSKSFISSSSSSLSISSTSSSSSPLNTSLNQTDKSNQLKNNFEQNYRILRTLNLEIHEARNVCFSPQFKSNKSNDLNNGQIMNTCLNNNVINYNHNLPMPKFHKDNLYYCLIMFNNDAIVASTRLNTCNNPCSQLGQLSQTQIISSNDYSCKDSIWDDSFSFDNLPLDVKELKICLLVIAKPTNFSSSFVNNLKKLNNSNKMSDPLLLGYVNIRLDDLINKGLFESWYTVEPAVQVDSKSEYEMNSCSIRVKIRFCEEKIYLNKNHYKSLSTYLLDENEHKNISILYEQIIPSTERSHFVQALLRFFIVKNKLIDMLKSFLLAEIDRCSDLSTLFRPATCSTSLMDQYMRVRCENFLHKVIEEPLLRIFKQTQQNSKSFELDPSKCPDPQQREQNLFNFQVALKDLINSICNQNSVNLFPNELKHLFCLIRQNVHQKWLKQKNGGTDDKLIKIYCVSAFVFLRLLCPALLNPKNFGLRFFPNSHNNKFRSTEFNYYELAQQFSVFSPAFMFTLSPTPMSLMSRSNSNLSIFNQSSHQINCFNVGSFLVSSNTSSSSSSSSIQNTSLYERHIKLLAKVLQTLANMTECKEPFMMPLSEFLSSNKPNIIKFIEDISNLNDFEAEKIQFEMNEYNEEQEEEEAIVGDVENMSINDKKLYESEMKNQFENSSCKYMAILNRLLYSLVPQMKIYIENLENSKRDNKEEDEELNENEILFAKSLKKLIDILNDINK